MNHTTEKEIALNFKVYMHVNKTNGKKYIGLTGQDVKRRWKNGSPYRQCTYFYRALLKYGWDGFEHIVIMSNMTENEAKEKEVELIRKHKTNNQEYGYNLMNGGQCNIPNEVTRKKRNYEIKKSTTLPEYKEKRRVMSMGESNGFYGKVHTSEAKEKMREKKLGGKHTDEHKKKVSSSISKSVVMLDKQGVLVKTFTSLTQAQKETGVSTGHVCECCKGNGRRKTAGGYKWMYLDEYEQTKALPR